MMTERGFTVTDDAIGEASHIFEKVRLTDSFGNGRYVRNLMERAIEKQSVRLMNTEEDISGIRRDIDSALDIISKFLTAIAAISMLVAGLGIMTTMLSNAAERDIILPAPCGAE